MFTTKNQTAAPVAVPSFTLDDMSAFDTLDQETLIGKMTYKGGSATRYDAHASR